MALVLNSAIFIIEQSKSKLSLVDSRNKVVPETIQMGVLHGMCLRLYKWEFYMGEGCGSRSGSLLQTN